MKKSIPISLLILGAAAAVLAFPADGEKFRNGADANYAPALAAGGHTWGPLEKSGDIFSLLRRAGYDSFRVRVWTGEEGDFGGAYAERTARAAAGAGLDPYPVIFLSPEWADYVKQPAPAEWRDLSPYKKAERIARYCEETTRRLRAAGCTSGLYEIGNEIDFGICGEFEPSWEKRFDFAHMRRNAWGHAAGLIRAAEAGVRRSDPQARFILHLTQWWNPDFCCAFLAAMQEQGVEVDYLGLSFFPSSGLSPRQTFSELDESVRKIHARTGIPVVICEYAYPSLPEFGGQFASWNREVPGYPLSEAGQAAWVADFLAFCREHPLIAGAYYWSPEWYQGETWAAFSLFRPDGTPKPALQAEGAPENKQPGGSSTLTLLYNDRECPASLLAKSESDPGVPAELKAAVRAGDIVGWRRGGEKAVTGTVRENGRIVFSDGTRFSAEGKTAFAVLKKTAEVSRLLDTPDLGYLQ